MLRCLQPVLLAVLLVGPAASAPRVKDKTPPATYWPTKVGTTREYLSDSGTEVEVVTAVERKEGVTTVTTATLEPDGRQTPSNKVEIRPTIYMVRKRVSRTTHRGAC